MRNPAGVSGTVHPSDEKTKLPVMKTATSRTAASNAKVRKQHFMCKRGSSGEGYD